MEELLRELSPQVLGVLVRRGADFAAAEDAVQEALVEAVRRWPDEMAAEPKGWLVTVAWRRFLDAQRSEVARQRREVAVAEAPLPGQSEQRDDTLLLLFLCCHPALSPASAVALTLRAVGGLTTRQIAEAYLVPEATMAQRISRAKRTVSATDLGEPGDLATVLKVLYLVFNEGYTGAVDLAAEAIRLTRQLAGSSEDPEVAGLLALMLLHHARRPARFAPDDSLVSLADQDRTRWDEHAIAEGVVVLQAALARDRLGEYQAQAAIAALHADARSAAETDWAQVLEWYDELARLTDSPVVALNRAVAVGEVAGPLAGLRAVAQVPSDVPRHTAVLAHFHERAGDRAIAHDLYVAAAGRATSAAERDHLTRLAARCGQDGPVLKNWAGNHTYVAERVHHPGSVAELQDVVAWATRIRALGTRHAFTDLADTTGDLVSTAELPADIEIEETSRSVRVAGGVRYGELADRLARDGWALATMASLPHISVAGAIATGTHGSGDRTGSLAAAVAGLEYVAADGGLRRVARGEPDFDGSVVALGALGVVTHVTLDIEPAYDVRQDLYTDLPWETAAEHFDALTASAYSVSLFTDWVSDRIGQVWLKSRGTSTPPTDLWGAPPATDTMHMLAGADTEAVTRQGGVAGPWQRRLPHFRMEFTPSRGEELQSEYLVPRDRALEAIARVRALAPSFTHLLQVTEVRTVAADPLWLSGAHGHAVVGLHFTWVRDVPGVYAVLPAIEAALLPLGARPHWGKCFVATTDDLRPLYPRFADFRDLVLRVDPDRKFGNAFLGRTLDLP